MSQTKTDKAASKLAVLSGLEAVARVEAAICGDAVAREPAVAEGMALAGRRAASLAEGPWSGAPGGAAGLRVSCVHHRRGGALGGAFELAASSAQQAADHCLVAHALSSRLGKAGSCLLDDGLAGALDLVQLPSPTAVNGALSGESAGDAAAVDDEAVVALAADLLASIGEKIGRRGDLLSAGGDAGASTVVVGAGGSGALARRAAEAAGVRWLDLALLRPFPATRVSEVLGGAQKVLALVDGELLGELRGAAPSGAELIALEPDGDLDALADELASQLAATVTTDTLSGEAGLGGRLIAAPASPWADAVLRRTAESLGAAGGLAVSRAISRKGGASLLSLGGDTNAALPADGDVILVSGAAALGGGPLKIARPGSVIVLQGVSSRIAELARALGTEVVGALREAGHRLFRTDALGAGLAASDSHPEDASCSAFAGAVAKALGGESDEADAADVAFGAGFAATEAVDVEALEAVLRTAEVDFRARVELPKMPTAPAEEEGTGGRWKTRIRRFHLTGHGALGPGQAPGVPVQPAALRTLAGFDEAMPPYPVVVAHDEQGVIGKPLAKLLTDAIEQGGVSRELEDNLGRFTGAVTRVLDNRDGGTGTLADVLAEASRRFQAELGLTGTDSENLAESLKSVFERMPADANVFDLRSETPLRLYLDVARAAREPAREAFAAEIAKLRTRLVEMLEVDHLNAEGARSQEALSAALGKSASRLLDTGALSKQLPKTNPGVVALGDVRRGRIEGALATLTSYLEGGSDTQPIVFVTSPDQAARVRAAAAGGEVFVHGDPLAAAIGVFDAVARRAADVFRAVWTARLDIKGSYDPALHDDAMAKLDWQALSAAELAVLPVVLVVTDGPRVRSGSLDSLSHLLRSSRPIHVLITDEIGAGDEASDLGVQFHAGLGYTIIAHREACAVQSNMARPGLLVDGLTTLSRALRPGVALVALPEDEPRGLRGLRALAACYGRVAPDYRYDPDAGKSFADCFDLAGNPSPEAAWPTVELDYLAEDGTEGSLELPFTWVDGVALEPHYASHFRVIPPEARDDEGQIPLADFLAGFHPESGDRRIPYLWVVDDSGDLQRAVITRQLAMAAVDHGRAWHILQELAGYDNAFAQRAAEAARAEAAAEAEARIAELEAAHAAELEEIGSKAARESMENLAAVLMNLDTAVPVARPAAEAAPAPAAATAEAVAEAEAAPAEAVEEEDDDGGLSFDEPYIDTPLCTSCNECVNTNPKLFAYNADKQATVSDAAAGTFAELVKAAGLCPARCIHPGKPRAGDATATPELIEKAAQFN